MLFSVDRFLISRTPLFEVKKLKPNKKQKVANDQTNEMLRESDLHDLQNELAGLKEDLITHGENTCSVFSESISMPKIDREPTAVNPAARIFARMRSAGQLNVARTDS